MSRGGAMSGAMKGEGGGYIGRVRDANCKAPPLGGSLLYSTGIPYARARAREGEGEHDKGRSPTAPLPRSPLGVSAPPPWG